MQSRIDRIIAEIEARRFPEAAVLIKRALGESPDEVLSHRINLAGWLMLAADWPLITRLLPPGTNFFTESGWLESVLQGRPVSREGEPIPWYTYPCIEFLEPRIRADFRVFEYGSGWSTLWWAQRVSQVRAVEHDPDWHAMVAARIPGNVELSLVADGDAYVGQVGLDGGQFDVVVVDGEHRNECAQAASRYVKPSGAIVFDNSDRRSYAEGVDYLSREGWLRIDFFGLIPSYAYKNCTSVFFRDVSWLAGCPVPALQASSVGRSCSQAVGD